MMQVLFENRVVRGAYQSVFFEPGKVFRQYGVRKKFGLLYLQAFANCASELNNVRN